MAEISLTVDELRFCCSQLRQWFCVPQMQDPVPFGMFVLETSCSEKTWESTKNGPAKRDQLGSARRPRLSINRR